MCRETCVPWKRVLTLPRGLGSWDIRLRSWCLLPTEPSPCILCLDLNILGWHYWLSLSCGQGSDRLSMQWPGSRVLVQNWVYLPDKCFPIQDFFYFPMLSSHEAMTILLREKSQNLGSRARSWRKPGFRGWPHGWLRLTSCEGGPYLHCPVTNSLSNDELTQGGHPVGPSPVNNELPVSHVSWLQPTVFTASVPSIIITLSLDATSNPIYSVGFSPSLATSLVRLKHYQNEQILQFWSAQTQGSTKGQVNKKPKHFFLKRKQSGRKAKKRKERKKNAKK